MAGMLQAELNTLPTPVAPVQPTQSTAPTTSPDTSGLTPEAFKAKILAAHPNATNSAGVPYAQIDATQLVQAAVKNHPDGVTSDGHKYSDYLPQGQSNTQSNSIVGDIEGGLGTAANAILSPAENLGAHLAELTGSATDAIGLTSGERAKVDSKLATNGNKNLTGGIVAPLQGGLTGAEQLGGDALQTGLMVGAPELGAADSLAGRIASNAVIGSGIGIGNAMSNGDGVTQGLIQGAEGAVAGGVGGSALEGAGILAKSLTTSAADKALQSGIQDATPSYTSKLIGDSETTANGAPRIQEGGGILKPRTVNPTQSEIDAGTELSKIPNYPAKGTALEKYNSVGPAIAQKGKALMQSLENENILRPPQEIKSIVQKAVNKAAEGSVLLQKADPAVTNYLRVAGRAIDQSPGTLAGEMQVRQTLDDAYEDAGGKYGNNKALDQIHRAARNALNDDMETKATNTAVKASLKEMSNLYNGMDTLKDKAMKEGGTALEKTMKNNPVLSKIGKTVANYAGLGGVLHLIP